jgi:hypothetical protein
VDHVVYVDKDAKELEKLIQGTKAMIVRGSSVGRVPYGRVNPGDVLYLIGSGDYADRLVCARATVVDVLNADTLAGSPATELLQAHQHQLQLTRKEMARWTRKRYLVLITVADVTPVPPFSIDRSNYGSTDDWLPVGDIERVMVRPSPRSRGQRFYRDADLPPND